MKLIKTEGSYYLSITDKLTNEFIASTDGMYVNHKLSVKNCDSIANGYDLEALSISFCGDSRHDANDRHFYQAGFKQAFEFLSDKKFSEEDVLKELNKLNTMPNSTLDTFTDDDEMITMKWFEQSLQQTEWDVEIEMMQLLTLDENGRYEVAPKLDENECLILKRKS